MAGDRGRRRLPPGLSPIPPGSRNHPGALAEENQRARLLAAAAEVFGERGYREAKVREVIERAGSSRTTFYAVFADKAACFAAVWEAIVGWLEAEAREAAGAEPSWPLRVREVVVRVLECLAAEPRLARVVVTESSIVGEEAVRRRGELVDRVAGALSSGRAEAAHGREISALFEQTLVGGAVWLVSRAVASGDPGRVIALAADLTELLLIPYVGREEARRVALG